MKLKPLPTSKHGIRSSRRQRPSLFDLPVELRRIIYKFIPLNINLPAPSKKTCSLLLVNKNLRIEYLSSISCSFEIDLIYFRTPFWDHRLRRFSATLPTPTYTLRKPRIQPRYSSLVVPPLLQENLRRCHIKLRECQVNTITQEYKDDLQRLISFLRTLKVLEKVKVSWRGSYPCWSSFCWEALGERLLKELRTLQLPKILEVICEDDRYSIGERHTRIDGKWIKNDLFPASHDLFSELE